MNDHKTCAPTVHGVALIALIAFCVLSPARAVPCGQSEQSFCAYYTLPNLFHNQFDTHRITFDTLPNGQPAVIGTLITPSFNWTDQGVMFAPGGGILAIGASLFPPFFDLAAVNYGVPFEQHNWIDVAFSPPVRALGFTAASITQVYAYDALGMLLGSAPTGFFSQFETFAGIASDIPIARIRIDGGGNAQAIDEFQFTPIPEPATFFLLIAAMPLIRHPPRPRPGTKRSPHP